MPSAKAQKIQRILAVRLDNIGDVIMLSPALRALKDQIPSASLTLLTSPGGAQVAPLLPWVDDVISWRASWQDISSTPEYRAEHELELVEHLKAGGFDAAFIFTSFSQSPYPPAYACLLAGIPYRAGQSREFGGTLLTQWVKPDSEDGYQVDRNIHLLRRVGIPVHNDRIELQVPEGISDEVDALFKEIGVTPGEPFIALAPGASASARRYNPERFLRAASLISDATNWPVIVVGTSRDLDLRPVNSPHLTDHYPGVKSLIERTSLGQMAEIIRRASLVLANNSAALHISESFLVPVVVLYAGTDTITQWAPRYTPKRILYREVSCSPCYAFDCPYQQECLEVNADEVVLAAFELLSHPVPTLIPGNAQIGVGKNHETAY